MRTVQTIILPILLATVLLQTVFGGEPQDPLGYRWFYVSQTTSSWAFRFPWYSCEYWDEESASGPCFGMCWSARFLCWLWGCSWSTRLRRQLDGRPACGRFWFSWRLLRLGFRFPPCSSPGRLKKTKHNQKNVVFTGQSKLWAQPD